MYKKYRRAKTIHQSLLGVIKNNRGNREKILKMYARQQKNIDRFPIIVLTSQTILKGEK